MFHKKAIYLQLFLASVIGAMALSLVSLYCLVHISDMVVEDYRYGYLMYMGRKIERTSEKQHVTKINVDKLPTPPLPPARDAAASIIKVTEYGDLLHRGAEEEEASKVLDKIPSERRNPKPSLWLVSKSGEIISGNTDRPLPVKWEELPRPRTTHGMVSNENFLFEPKTFIVKLDTEPVTFLVSHNERSLFQGPFLWIQGIHTFTTVALAVFIALSICFYYLRRKSKEARDVLAKMESGDLKSRFEIKRFDQFGNLILDFNRMADEIERLVKRLNDTETSRSHLLQELGHDLRTPLTSLGTSFEALKLYNNLMTQEEREELFGMIESDIHYFRDLLEKLTIIATIDESHYKSSTEKINLASLLEDELKHRQAFSGSSLNWSITTEDDEQSFIFGDPHLISRLFKNAFDNASRYAQAFIHVEVKNNLDSLEIKVTDDGPGLTSEAIQSFGKRRERRQVKERDPRNFSLGLGSVIMRTIAEVHDGTLAIANSELGGACLRIKFKKA